MPSGHSENPPATLAIAVEFPGYPVTRLRRIDGLEYVEETVTALGSATDQGGLIGFYREIAGVGLLTKCESGLEQFKLADCWKDVWSPLPRSGNIGTAPLQEQASVICF